MNTRIPSNPSQTRTPQWKTLVSDLGIAFFFQLKMGCQISTTHSRPSEGDTIIRHPPQQVSKNEVNIKSFARPYSSQFSHILANIWDEAKKKNRKSLVPLSIGMH